jgi:hypothetical protein
VLGDDRRGVEPTIDNLGRDVRYRAGIDVVSEKIANHPASAGAWEPVEKDPLLLRHYAAMEPHVPATALPADGKRELVDISSEIPDAVEVGGRGMRDNRDVRIVESTPSRLARVKLEPRSAEPKMVGLASTTDPIHPVSNPLDPTVLDETGERGLGNARLTGLPPGDKAPLLLR